MNNNDAENELVETTAAVRSELLKFPKPPVRGVRALFVVQVKLCWLASLALPLFTFVCYIGTIYSIDPEFWTHSMKASLALSAGCLLGLVCTSFWTATLARRLRHIAAGNYYVRWPQIDESSNLANQNDSPNLIKFSLICAMIAVGIRLPFAGVNYGDGKFFFATTAAHFGFIALMSISFGAAIGIFLWKLAVLRYEIVAQQQNPVLIGPEGLYQTGRFWSFKGTNQSLYDVSISTDKPEAITFKIGTSSEHGLNYEIISISIPRGELLKAKVLRQILSNSLAINIIRPSQSGKMESDRAR